jgi:MFS family permease
MTELSGSASSAAAPQAAPGIKPRLSIMMFLQYAIWGAWLPLFFAFLTGHRGIKPEDAGTLFSIGAVGALFAPFIAGQIADRWFNTEKFLAISHLIGAVLVWRMASVETWGELAVYGLLYSLVYAPTLALTNALAFHHLPDRDRDFGKVRVWGTIGWIVVGIGVGQWLLRRYTPPAEPVRQSWVAAAASERPADPSRAEALRKTLLEDDAIKGAPAAGGGAAEPGLLQKIVDNGRAASTDEALDRAVNRAVSGASAVRQDLISLGWDEQNANAGADRVATAVAREELVLQAAGQAPADINATLADSAVKAVTVENRVRGMADSLRLSAILGAVMGLYCLLLPKTPPRPGKQAFAAAEALGEIGSKRALWALFLIAFPISVIHQFYFVLTAPFLNSQINVNASFIDKIFGVGGGGLMTIGQISEIVVLALVPVFVKRFSRKTFLAVGLIAYILRFAVFAYLPVPAAVIPALALHGVCFGCFFFIAFMIVDELTTKDVRASAQGLFNLVIVGLGVIVGNLFAGWVAKFATKGGATDYTLLFTTPMWVAVVCLVLLLLLYPRRKPETARAAEGDLMEAGAVA